MGKREWDTRIVWNQRHSRWWWNAWRETTATELWGFADTPEDALRAMTTAIQNTTATVTPITQHPPS